MAQILNPQPTWQEALGSGLGSGIQAGVQGLLEQKLAQMAQERQFAQREKTIDALAKAGYFGDQSKLTPEILQGLKYAPESTINTLLKGQINAPQRAAESQAAMYQAQGMPVEEIVTKVPGLSGNFIKELNKAAAGSAKEQAKLQQQGVQATQKYRDELSARVKADEEKASKLVRLKNLILNEKVATGLMGSLPGVFQNQATQEAAGLINEILIPLEGRANTDAKLRGIMDSFAKLGDTKEAQLQKIDLALELTKISKAEKDAEKKIIEEKGYPPWNLADLAWERSAPERQKIYDRISNRGQDWQDASDMPASQYAGKERILEDGTIEYSNGKQWVKGRNPNKERKL